MLVKLKVVRPVDLHRPVGGVMTFCISGDPRFPLCDAGMPNTNEATFIAVQKFILIPKTFANLLAIFDKTL